MSESVPMLLWCPACGGRHVDVGDFATKVHHTHSCQHCGLTWRPAVVPTTGVEFLPGYKNGTPPVGDGPVPSWGERVLHRASELKRFAFALAVLEGLSMVISAMGHPTVGNMVLFVGMVLLTVAS